MTNVKDLPGVIAFTYPRDKSGRWYAGQIDYLIYYFHKPHQTIKEFKEKYKLNKLWIGYILEKGYARDYEE